MDTFSYTDNIRAALAACLPCFAASRPKAPSHPSSSAHPEPRSASIASAHDDLEHLLRDTDSDALSLHSNLGVSAHRRAKHRRRPRFALTLFGYTLLGRPPIYLEDDHDDASQGGRTRALITASSSTLDSDAAPLDASTIERLTSPDHYAALVAQREREQHEAAEAARRKAERRARRQDRKARARAEALVSLTSGSPRSDVGTFEGFQGSGDGLASPRAPDHLDLERERGLHSGDADDADLGGELYTRKKALSAAFSGSGSDSRSRTSASFSAGDASHIQNVSIHTHPRSPYPQTEMRLPTSGRKKSHHTSKPLSTVSSVTSQSTSPAPYTPVESLMEVPAVAASPIPQERYIHDGERTDFPSIGLPGKRRTSSIDPRPFLAHQG